MQNNYINKYNKTTTKKKNKKKQELRLMFGYQPTKIVVRWTALYQKFISTKGNRLFSHSVLKDIFRNDC